MTDSHTQRIRPARIISLVFLMILAGSAARADVIDLRSLSAKPTRIGAALASSLALPQQQVTRESSKLRTTFAREERQQRDAATSRRRWTSGHRAAEQKTSAPQPTGTTSVVHSSSANWYAIAACESGGRWSLNTGNGFYGGLQFSMSTWRAYGGGAFDGVGPFPFSAGEQIAVAERVLAGQGPSAWPNCFSWA